MIRFTALLILPALCMGAAPDANAGSVVIAPTRIYYTASTTSYGYLSCVDTASGEETDVYVGPSDGRPITPAISGETLYWSTYYPGRIRRSDLEGGGLETVVDQGDTTTRAIEFHDGYVYWSNESLGAIYRARPDFGTVETVISGHSGYDGGIWDFAIYDDRFYWTSWDSSLVRSTNLDGTDPQTINPAAHRAFSLEVADGRLFVGDTGNKRILSTALDGTDRQVLVNDVNPNGMEIFNGRLYYNNAYETRDICSIPLAGGVPQYEATTDRSSFQLTVVPEPSTLMLLAMGALGLLACVLRRRRLPVLVRACPVADVSPDNTDRRT